MRTDTKLIKFYGEYSSLEDPGGIKILLFFFAISLGIAKAGLGNRIQSLSKFIGNLSWGILSNLKELIGALSNY